MNIEVKRGRNLLFRWFNVTRSMFNVRIAMSALVDDVIMDEFHYYSDHSALLLR
jgi:hypothetical protein